MAVIEVKKPSIDGDKEALKKETTKEINDLRKEVEKNGPLTKEDAENYIKETRKNLVGVIDAATLKLASQGLNIDKDEVKVLDKMFSKLFGDIRNNPNAYLEKDEDGKGYNFKEEAYNKWINSLSQEELEVMKKYEIE